MAVGFITREFRGDVWAPELNFRIVNKEMVFEATRLNEITRE